MNVFLNQNPFNTIRSLWLHHDKIGSLLNEAFDIGLSELNIQTRIWSGPLTDLEAMGLIHKDNYIASTSGYLLKKHFPELLSTEDYKSLTIFGNMLCLTLASFVVEYEQKNNSIKFNPIYGNITGHWDAERSPTYRDEGTIISVTTGASRTKFTQMLFDQAHDIEMVVSCIANRLDLLPQEFLDGSRPISINELRQRKQMIDIIPLHPDQWCPLNSHKAKCFNQKSQFMLDGHMVGSDDYNHHCDLKPVALKNIQTFVSKNFKIFVEGLPDDELDFIYNERFYDLFTKDANNADAKIIVKDSSELSSESYIGIGSYWALQGVDFECNTYKVSVSEQVKQSLTKTQPPGM